MTRVWIDIDNPPQVQYMLPFKDELERRGHEVTVTARRHGITHELLAERGVAYRLIGAEAGAGKVRKVTAIVGRALALTRAVRPFRPDLVLTTSRAGALAGRALRRPVFALIDYEHANLTVQRLAGCHILFPEAIGADTFVAKGFPRERLVSFPSLKEAITFANVDVAAIPPHDFGREATGAPLLLFRPPAEQAHYYSGESFDVALEALRAFADRDDVQVVLSPRYPHQVEYLSRFTWRVAPIVLDRPVPSVPLLRAVDAVMASGGTMLREAAYLGVPAYSIFRSELGAVDRVLVDRGALQLVSDADAFRHLAVTKRSAETSVVERGDVVLGELVDRILAQDAGRR